MKNIIMLLFSILLLLETNAQSVFKYSDFTFRKIPFIRRELYKGNAYQKIPREWDKIPSHTIIVPFLGEYCIKHICKESFQTNAPISDEFLEILCKRYSIDSLLMSNITSDKFYSPFYIMFNNDYYKFKTAKNNFILLNATNRQLTPNIEICYWFLIDVTKLDSIKIFTFIDASGFNPNCFSYFTNLDNLSYLSIQHNNNWINLFNFEGNRFIKDTNNHIYLSPDSNVKVNLKYNYVAFNIIDWHKTHWIYKKPKQF